MAKTTSGCHLEHGSISYLIKTPKSDQNKKKNPRLKWLRMRQLIQVDPGSNPARVIFAKIKASSADGAPLVPLGCEDSASNFGTHVTDWVTASDALNLWFLY